MCFLLYAGTAKPILRKNWDQEAPGISVQSLKGDEEKIAAHFNSPEIQNIGSTSGCECDFPWVMFQNGDWPVADVIEPELQTSEQLNRQLLVELLRSIDEQSIELYGIWAGDYAVEPASSEVISLVRILDSAFHFKERGHYQVELRDSAV